MTDEDLKSDRWEAARAGDTRFLGRPCPKCGSSVRHTSSGQCVDCTVKRATERGRKLRDTLREGKRAASGES